MGWLKLLISFVVIGCMSWNMNREHPDDCKEEELWKFEIPAAILAAGWIAREGW